jgi:OPA family sugar phosphate sensor protein UhpC-like MFS transporter
VGAFIDRLKPAPHKPEITDRETVEKDYKHWRIRVFYSMYVGYALYYLTRKSFTFAMPSLMQDLGFDKGHLGFLGSVLAISYGVSKFASGILSDQSNPRYFMAFGLMATGVFNILFGLSSSIYFFALFWGLNGWFQGFGWPACARLLTHWYSQNERGRWWSIWNTSQHLAGALVPVATAVCVYFWGWRAAMIFPGVLVFAGGFFLMNRLCDTPQSLGLPPIEKFRNDYQTIPEKGEERDLTTKEILFGHVLNNPFIWILGVSYFFVYVIRQGVNDWTVLYLVETKGYSQLGAASVVFWYEVGGFLGSIAAGWSSDKIFSGNRGPINALFCLLAVAAVYAFWCVSGYAPVVDAFLVFALGFLIFGPQMLIGVAAAELSHKKAAGTATGFIGWLAYLGAAFAGWPLGKIAQDYGWEGYFITLSICAVVATALLFPLWNAKPAKQPVPVREKASS